MENVLLTAELECNLYSLNEIKGMASLSERARELACLIKNRVDLTHGIYYTHLDNLGLVIDTNIGKIYTIDLNTYKLEVDGSVLFINLQWGKIFLVNQGLISLDGIENSRPSDYTVLSGNKYEAVRLNHTYSASIKSHVIIVSMVYGYKTLLAMDTDRMYDIHHKLAWGLSHDNSISNLQLLPRSLHKLVHSSGVNKEVVNLMIGGGLSVNL